ncbi:MAG: hypothetical protein ACLQDV_27520 [Candidatus Binataceae bacterium]
MNSQNVKLAALYAVMILGAAALYLLVRLYGESLIPLQPATLFAAPGAARTGGPDVMLHVLLTLVVVIVGARAVGSLFAFFHQPPVVGAAIANHIHLPINVVPERDGCIVVVQGAPAIGAGPLSA